MKAKIKNIVSGKNVDYTFKSNESVETLDVTSVEMQFLYADNELVHLMDERTFEQYEISREVVGDVVKFLKEGTKHFVYLYQDKPLAMRPPLSVKLKIVEAENAAKGDTVGGVKKAVKLETGVTVMAPIFVKVGEVISVNPETGEYTGRE
jgi:elongation factor P